MSQNRNRIAEFFREARRNSGLDLADAAEEAEVSVEEMEQYENGSIAIPLDSIFGLTNLYNVSPDEVVALFYELSISADADEKTNAG